MPHCAMLHTRTCEQVRTQFRKIFTQMGFEEMPTSNYVESSFWNFDALFQPQQVGRALAKMQVCGTASNMPHSP